MKQDDQKNSLEETLKRAYHGTPIIKPEEYRKFLGTFEERVLLFLLKEELRDDDKLQKVEEYMDYDRAQLLLINSKYVKELSGYINMAKNKGLNYRVVSRKEGSTDVILVIASNKAIQYDNN